MIQNKIVRLHSYGNLIDGTILYPDDKWPDQIVHNNKVYRFTNIIDGGLGIYEDAHVTKLDTLL